MRINAGPPPYHPPAPHPSSSTVLSSLSFCCAPAICSLAAGDFIDPTDRLLAAASPFLYRTHRLSLRCPRSDSQFRRYAVTTTFAANGKVDSRLPDTRDTWLSASSSYPYSRPAFTRPSPRHNWVGSMCAAFIPDFHSRSALISPNSSANSLLVRSPRDPIAVRIL